MIKKSIASEFKDVDVKSGTVCGYFSSFGNKDLDGDIIVKGAYEKTIRERGPSGKNLVAHLLDHKKDNAVGTIQVLKEDDFGLYYESKAGRHTAGRDFLLMVEDGIIKNHSVGFYPIVEKWVGDANYITEIELLEGSSLQFLGASDQTPIVGVKSIQEDIDALNEIERKIKNARYSDEAIISIEKQLVSLRKELDARLQVERADDSEQSIWKLYI